MQKHNAKLITLIHGDDTYVYTGGNDVILGGADGDILSGGADNDRIYADAQIGAAAAIAAGNVVNSGSGLKGDWLAKGGVVEGASFAARGYFDVPADGLYQFQFRGNLLGSCRVKIDEELQAIPDGEEWRSLAVSLTKGTHRLTLSGRGEDKPQLDVRFGGPGCRTVDDKRFRRGVAEP